MVKIVVLFFLLIPNIACAQQSPKKTKWNFDDLKGWVYCHQDDNPQTQCEIEKGKLKIYTQAGSRDRKKMRTEDRIYTTGRYTWRTYISDIGEKDQTSIGSWLYHDDKHEIDFEVGPGNARIREQLNAAPDDLIAYLTTQGHPYHTLPVKIKPGWHIFEIDITLVNGKYKIDWIIDNKLLSSVNQTYGKEIAFYIYCSVENLKFIGSHLAEKDNYGLFDYVKYEYHE